MPFVAFHVDRILERTDTRSAEGRDHAFRQLLPALKGPAARRVRRRAPAPRRRQARAERGAAGDSLIEGAARQNAGRREHCRHRRDRRCRRADRSLDQGVRAERTFLALCIALPAAGARTLFEIDPDQLITSELMRRAARHLAGRTQSPLADLPPDDEQLARTVAALVEEAGLAGQRQRRPARARSPAARAGPARPRDPSRQDRGRERHRRAGPRARGGDGGPPYRVRAARKGGVIASPALGRRLPQRLGQLRPHGGQHRLADLRRRSGHAPGRSGEASPAASCLRSSAGVIRRYLAAAASSNGLSPFTPGRLDERARRTSPRPRPPRRDQVGLRRHGQDHRVAAGPG